MVDLSNKRPILSSVLAIRDDFGLEVKHPEFVPNTEPAIFRIKSGTPLHGSYDPPDESNIIDHVVRMDDGFRRTAKTSCAGFEDSCSGAG